MEQYEYRYFISYFYIVKNASGFGNMEHRTNAKITNIQDIKKAANVIKKGLGADGVTIINFTLFED